MFSVRQKREISEKVQQILRETAHPELPTGEITFLLHVNGAESWSWADICNNGAVSVPNVNPHNERMDAQTEEEPHAHPPRLNSTEATDYCEMRGLRPEV